MNFINWLLNEAAPESYKLYISQQPTLSIDLIPNFLILYCSLTRLN